MSGPPADPLSAAVVHPATTPAQGAAWGVFDHSASWQPSEVVPSPETSPSAAPPDPQLTQFLRQLPPRWAVYLMADGSGRPVQLLCVKNLRQSLKRRLSPSTADAPLDKRVNYRDLVRQVYWRRVDSHFEADLVYLHAARSIFPHDHHKLLTTRPVWFLHVDPDAEFPRFQKTQEMEELSTAPGLLLGPIEEKGQAARLVERVESAFDLCRYHQILTQAPLGRACSYKDMGRCPAPCDGSISMQQYRRMVELAVRVLVDPDDATREHQARMRQAAAELRFELAGKIKSYVDELSELRKGGYRHVRPFTDFRFVALQHGPTEGSAKVFLITQGTITEEAALLCEPESSSDLLRLLLEKAEGRSIEREPGGEERVRVVAQHLLSPRPPQQGGSGVFIPLAELEERSLAKAYRELMKQTESTDRNVSETESTDEGVLREGVGT